MLLGEILIPAPDLKAENYALKDCRLHLQSILPALLLVFFLQNFPDFLTPKGCFIDVTRK